MLFTVQCIGLCSKVQPVQQSQWSVVYFSQPLATLNRPNHLGLQLRLIQCRVKIIIGMISSGLSKKKTQKCLSSILQNCDDVMVNYSVMGP